MTAEAEDSLLKLERGNVVLTLEVADPENRVAAFEEVMGILSDAAGMFLIALPEEIRAVHHSRFAEDVFRMAYRDEAEKRALAN
jgi:hypothetical protein